MKAIEILKKSTTTKELLALAASMPGAASQAEAIVVRRALSRTRRRARRGGDAGVGARSGQHSRTASLPGEPHLGNVHQLTNTGTQAEAYFSRDGQWITFQSSREGRPCDQQYVMKTDGTALKRVSNGKGKTTCGWFLPDGKTLFFGSSHANQAECPPKLDPAKGYVWGLDPFDIYTVNRDGTGLKRITNYNTYTAEGVLSPDGKRFVFTSLKDGDLDIYTMNVDGIRRPPAHASGRIRRRPVVVARRHQDRVSRISPDRSRGAEGLSGPAQAAHRSSEQDGIVGDERRRQRSAPDHAPRRRELRAVVDARWQATDFLVELQESAQRQLRLISSSGSMAADSSRSRPTKGFDGFPMFSPDGKKLIWASQRADSKSMDVNLFIADFKP